jgi:hypothetical protein
MLFLSMENYSQIKNKYGIIKTQVLTSPTKDIVRLNTIPPLNSSFEFLWNQSQMQQDIIGSDFYGKQEIGTAAAERFGPNGHVLDWWFPLNAFKKTIGGELFANEMFEVNLGQNLGDYDQNLDIIPTADYANDFRFSIQKADDRIDGKDPLVDDDVPNTACSEDDYKNFRINWMEFEIDLHQTNARMYFDTHTPNAPKIKSSSSRGDTVFAYGPWVSDAGHCHKPEIHPAEQIWWRKKVNENKATYYLLLSADQSNRFNKIDNYDENEIIGQDRYLKQVWAAIPQKGVFAIVFKVAEGKERCYVDITRISGQEISAQYAEGQLHYLVYKNDTLAVVKEPFGNDQIKVSFQKVCIGNFSFYPSANNNIYGFVVLETQVGRAQTSTNEAKGGYQFLKVSKEIKPLNVSIKLPNTN